MNCNGLAQTIEPGDHFVTHCIFLTASILFVIPMVVHFKEDINILQIQVFEQFHHIRIHTTHVFYLFLALYCILQELRQLHPHDKKFQQPVAE